MTRQCARSTGGYRGVISGFVPSYSYRLSSILASTTTYRGDETAPIIYIQLYNTHPILASSSEFRSLSRAHNHKGPTSPQPPSHTSGVAHHRDSGSAACACASSGARPVGDAVRGGRCMASAARNDRAAPTQIRDAPADFMTTLGVLGSEGYTVHAARHASWRRQHATPRFAQTT